MLIIRGEQKKPKPKTEPQNRKNRTEKPVNRIEFYEIFGSVNRTDFVPRFTVRFRFGGEDFSVNRG